MSDVRPPSPPPSPGARTADGARYAVVAARYNPQVVEGLLKGCREVFAECGVVAVQVVRVPGVFELPLALQWLARTERFQGLVALGALLRGDTAHFDLVATACARGIEVVSLESSLPIGFGVLTAHTMQQARERSGAGPKNRGREAALATLEMVRLGAGLRG